MKILFLAFIAKIVSGLVLLGIYVAVAFDRLKRAREVYREKLGE